MVVIQVRKDGKFNVDDTFLQRIFNKEELVDLSGIILSQHIMTKDYLKLLSEDNPNLTPTTKKKTKR